MGFQIGMQTFFRIIKWKNVVFLSNMEKNRQWSCSPKVRAMGSVPQKSEPCKAEKEMVLQADMIETSMSVTSMSVTSMGLWSRHSQEKRRTTEILLLFFYLNAVTI